MGRRQLRAGGLYVFVLLCSLVLSLPHSRGEDAVEPHPDSLLIAPDPTAQLTQQLAAALASAAATEARLKETEAAAAKAAKTAQQAEQALDAVKADAAQQKLKAEAAATAREEAASLAAASANDASAALAAAQVARVEAQAAVAAAKAQAAEAAAKAAEDAAAAVARAQAAEAEALKAAAVARAEAAAQAEASAAKLSAALSEAAAAKTEAAKRLSAAAAEAEAARLAADVLAADLHARGLVAHGQTTELLSAWKFVARAAVSVVQAARDMTERSSHQAKGAVVALVERLGPASLVRRDQVVATALELRDRLATAAAVLWEHVAAAALLWRDWAVQQSKPALEKALSALWVNVQSSSTWLFERFQVSGSALKEAALVAFHKAQTSLKLTAARAPQLTVDALRPAAERFQASAHTRFVQLRRELASHCLHRLGISLSTAAASSLMVATMTLALLLPLRLCCGRHGSRKSRARAPPSRVIFGSSAVRSMSPPPEAVRRRARARS